MIADATVGPLQALITGGGVVGAFFVLALLDWIELRPAIERRDRSEARQQALIDTLLAVYHHEVLPTLGDYEKRLAPILRQVEERLKELEWTYREDRDRDPEAGYPGRRRYQDHPRGGGGHGAGPGDYPPAP